MEPNQQASSGYLNCLELCYSIELGKIECCYMFWDRLLALCIFIRKLLLHSRPFEANFDQLTVLLGKVKTIKGLLSKKELFNLEFTTFDDLFELENCLKLQIGKLADILGLATWEGRVSRYYPKSMRDLNKLQWMELTFERNATFSRMHDCFVVSSLPQLHTYIYHRTIKQAEARKVVQLARLLKRFNPVNLLIDSLLFIRNNNVLDIRDVLQKYEDQVKLRDLDFSTVLIDSRCFNMHIKDFRQMLLTVHERKAVSIHKLMHFVNHQRIEKDIIARRSLHLASNIANISGYFVADKLVNIVMPSWYSNGTLFQFLHNKVKKHTFKSLDNNTKLEIAVGIANGLSILHSFDLIHRNLNSLNILLQKDLTACISIENLIKLRRNLSLVFPESLISTVSSVYWRPPEMLIAPFKFSKKSDIWSLGVIIWELFTGKVPFNADKNFRLLKHRIICREKPGLLEDINDEVGQIINLCWEYEPSRRPSAEEVLEGLKTIRTKLRLSVVKEHRPSVNTEAKGYSLDNCEDDCFVSAIKNNDLNLGKVLLKYEKSLVENINKNFTLHIAASCGSTDFVSILLQKGANIEAQDLEKNTALHYSVKFGYLDIVKLLLSQNSSIVDIQNSVGETAMHLAVSGDFVEVVEGLIKHGASLEISNIDGNTPIELIKEKNASSVRSYFESLSKSAIVQPNNAEFDQEIVEPPVKHVASKVNSPPKDPSWAKINPREIKLLVLKVYKEIRENRIESLIAFLQSGVCFRQLDYVFKSRFNDESYKDLLVALNEEESQSLILVAYKSGNYELVKWLAEVAKIDSRLVDNDNNSLIHYAAMDGNLGLVKFFTLDIGIEVDVVNSKKETISTLASRNNHEHVLRWIHFFINIKSPERKSSSLHIASNLGELDLAKWLVERDGSNVNAIDDFKNTPLHYSALKGHIEVTKWLISHGGANVYAENQDGYIPLHLACINGHVEIVEWMAKNNYGIVKNTNKKDGSTLLHSAAIYGQIEVVKFLVEKGKAEIECGDKFKATPLHRAVERGHLNIVKWLVQVAKAKVNSSDKYKSTPLHYGSENGYLDIVIWLIREGGAEVNTTNKSGWTPLHHAAEKGNFKMVRWLVKEGGAKGDIKSKSGETAEVVAQRHGSRHLGDWLLNECK